MFAASHDSSGATYARVSELPLQVDRCELLPLVRDVSSGFTKISSVVRLTGGGHEGLGEDITWDQIDQIELLRHAGGLSWLRGARTIDEFSTLLGLADLFPVEPIRPSARFYRRWAFESAALDLALRQSGMSLADALGRSPEPVSFVVSTGLGEPAGLERLHELREGNPSLRFKLDPTASWTEALLSDLAAMDCVDVIDMKGRYENATVAMAADPDLYRRVFEALPSAWIEDPAIVDDTAELLTEHHDRITWDEPIHGTPDIEALPWTPRVLNLKPSRFGSIRRLFDTYDFCAAVGIGAYGGGMFEQGPGRGQLQYLASLFHPDGPNDLAPVEYNLRSLPGPAPRRRSHLHLQRQEAVAAGLRRPRGRHRLPPRALLVPRCRRRTTRPASAGATTTGGAASASEPPPSEGSAHRGGPARRPEVGSGR